MKRKIRKLFILLIVLGFGSGVLAQQQDDWDQVAQLEVFGGEVFTLAPVMVVGSADAVRGIAGSAAFIPKDLIRNQTYTDVNRVLQQVPGVYVRGEGGFGNFPNISLRGTDPGRSAKLTLMEDGVMMAPAPYSAPAAYFSPKLARMSGLEVLKGSSQIKYGPHTTGGVVNYLSSEIPEERRFYLKSTYGSDNFTFFQGNFGDVVTGDFGELGYLLEFHGQYTDGFRDIQRSGGGTGFELAEPMLKLRWRPDSLVPQEVEFKFGYTHFDADESYLGLGEEDLAKNPYRRYLATQFDNISSDQWRSHFRYTIEPTDDFLLRSTVYFTQFSRNWYKLHDIRDADGEPHSLSQALVDDDLRGILSGDAAGQWRLRNNNRDYQSFGVDNQFELEFDTGAVSHRMEGGVRFHWDEVRRLQQDEFFDVNSNGSIVASRLGEIGAAGNRKQETFATALYLQHQMGFFGDRLRIKPGLRYENLQFEYQDFGSGSTVNDELVAGEGSLDIWAPGVSAIFDIDDQMSVFGGYYRGFSTPSPRNFIRDGIKEETTDGFELGGRYFGENFQLELVGFYTKFDDLLVTDVIGGSGTGTSANVGVIDVLGAELALRWNPGEMYQWGFGTPLRVAATYTDAKLDGDIVSADPEGLFAGGQDGNRMPYIPEYALSFGAGVEFEKFALYLDASYTPLVFTSASNTTRQIDAAGDHDARFGELDSSFLLDISAHYQISEQVEIIGGILNLLDEQSVISRQPHGPRNNRPRSYFIGLEMNF